MGLQSQPVDAVVERGFDTAVVDQQTSWTLEVPARLVIRQGDA